MSFVLAFLFFCMYACKYVECIVTQYVIRYVGTGAPKRGARAADSVPDVLPRVSLSCVLFNLYCFKHVDPYFSLPTVNSAKM